MTHSEFQAMDLPIKHSSFNAHSIRNFISGEVPRGGPYFIPDGEPLPIDENGNPTIRLRQEGTIGDNGRGRLLTAIEALRLDDEITEEMAVKLFHINRDLTAFLSDLGVEVVTADYPIDFVATYRLYYPEHVLFYPDPLAPQYVEYRDRLTELDRMVLAGETPPTSLLNFLTQREEELFSGEANIQARDAEMKRRVEMHLGDNLVRTVIAIVLYGEERLRQMGEAAEPESKRLYPNSKVIDSKKHFAIAKTISDHLGRGVEHVNRERAITQYTASGTHHRTRKAVYKIDSKGGGGTEFTIDQAKFAIDSAEQFAERIVKIKDPKVIQTFLALMKWSSNSDSAVFRDVPVSELMELVLKPTGDSKFNTQQRREFSEILEYLAAMTITASIITESWDAKKKKNVTVLKARPGVRILKLEATYSVKKEFQGLPKDQLDKDLHFDTTVITKVSGELLPDAPFLFQERASVFSNGLLHFDANKDSKAIVLGFKLQTRFNQLQDKDKFIEVERAWLIDLCDYQQTNKTKPSQATKQLANTLNKLVDAGIISTYSKLTNTNSDRVRITPPKPAKEKAIG